MSPGTAVFLFKDLGKAPPALVNNLRHNKVLHETTLIVSIETAEVPRRARRTSERIVTKIAPGVFQVQLCFGFMEEPDVPAALWRRSSVRGLDYDHDDVTYFIGRESIVAGKAPGHASTAEHLFVLLNRGADSASRFFNLPADQVSRSAPGSRSDVGGSTGRSADLEQSGSIRRRRRRDSAVAKHRNSEPDQPDAPQDVAGKVDGVDQGEVERREHAENDHRC